MNAFVPFIIIGLVNGSVYGMAASGLVVTYQATGVFNFAYGALATAAAYLFYFMHVKEGIAWPIAFICATLLLSIVMTIGLEPLGRVLRRQSMVTRIVTTIGLIVFVEAAANQWYGTSAQTYPTYLPTSVFHILGTAVEWQQLVIVVTAIVFTGLLLLLLRRTRLGIAMRAVVEDDQLVALCGRKPRQVRRYAWFIGCFMATIAGVLLAPTLSLDSNILTEIMIAAFAAAALARFVYPERAWLGGLLVGVVAAILTKYITTQSILTGLPAAFPFLVLFIVLLFYRTRWVRQDPQFQLSRVHDGDKPMVWKVVALVGVLGLLILVPAFVGEQLGTWTQGLTVMMVLLSLGLLIRVARSVSLCQIAFSAIGAAAFSELSVHLHVPWGIALIGAGLIACPIGALIGWVSMRLSGLYLALATLGFGIGLEQMFYQTNIMFGTSPAGIIMPTPGMRPFNDVSGVGFYYLVVAIVLVVVVVSWLLISGRYGRLLRAMSESRESVIANGGSITVAQVALFSYSAFIAALAGALMGIGIGTVTGLNFSSTNSLLYAAVVAITPGALPWYALIGGGFIGILPGYYNSNTVVDILGMIFGLGAVAAAFDVNEKIAQRIRRKRTQNVTIMTDDDRREITASKLLDNHKASEEVGA